MATGKICHSEPRPGGVGGLFITGAGSWRIRGNDLFEEAKDKSDGKPNKVRDGEAAIASRRAACAPGYHLATLVGTIPQ
jgi:hypothetical protein